MNVPAPKFLVEKTWEGRVFGGDWRNAAGGALDVLEPATGNKITSVGNASAADIRKAAAEARAAQPGWAATPYEERAAVLRKAARALEDNQEELIPWIARETGGIPAKAGFEIHMVTEILYRSAAMCTEPQGLVLPSDPGPHQPRAADAARRHRRHFAVQFPADSFVPRGSAGARDRQRRRAQARSAHRPDRGLHHRPHLRGGRPAQRAFCMCCRAAPRPARRSARIPDIAMVSFTGSSNVGRRIGELAGKHLKKVQLELGGKNAVIVFEDADLDAAASAIAFGSGFDQGTRFCMTTGLVGCASKIVAPLTKKLVDKAQHLPVGDPLSQVALGPVINSRRRSIGFTASSRTRSRPAQRSAGGTFDGTASSS